MVTNMLQFVDLLWFGPVILSTVILLVGAFKQNRRPVEYGAAMGATITITVFIAINLITSSISGASVSIDSFSLGGEAQMSSPLPGIEGSLRWNFSLGFYAAIAGSVAGIFAVFLHRRFRPAKDIEFEYPSVNKSYVLKHPMPSCS